MDSVQNKIRRNSLIACIAIALIVLMLGAQTIAFLFGWWTTGGALSNPEAIWQGKGLISQFLLVTLLAYTGYLFWRISVEETPFFKDLPRKIKAGAVLLFLVLTVPKWLAYALISFQTGEPAFTIIDESVIFAFMLSAIVFSLGSIIEYGFLVQDENYEIL